MRKSIIALALTGIVLISSGIILLIYRLTVPFISPNDYPRVYIHPDGTIEPPSTQISCEGNLYTLEADITLYKLFIEKSNITLDGNGFSFKIFSPNGTKMGPGLGSLELTNVENVTIRNIDTSYPKLSVNNFYENYSAAILIFEDSSFCESVNSKVSSVSINNSFDISVSGSSGAVKLTNSSNCTISSCIINAYNGITLKNSHGNMILNNDMTQMKVLALTLKDSNGNLFFGNRIERTHKFIEITGSSDNNLLVGNYIRGAFSYIPVLDASGVNTFYHNNFFYVYLPLLTSKSRILWDNGSEGNYWNDYQGKDANGDGIGDTPHIIDDNNVDRYPLMNPLDLSSEPLPQLPK